MHPQRGIMLTPNILKPPHPVTPGNADERTKSGFELRRASYVLRMAVTNTITKLVVLSSARMLEKFERSWMQLHPSIHNTSIPAARRTQFIPPASAPIYFFDGPLGPPQAKVRRAKFDSLF
mmetsp:Transcript_17145/g.25687  ORF Transcript_17145/g.25687 Transcript_17145/m.25687 type:complete len:121 (-) Transcript_17145:21-383(-)